MSKMQRRNTLVNYNPSFDTEKDEPKHVEMSSKTASKFAEFANRVKIARLEF